MIVLRSPELLVRVDPRHGGEILDLVDLATGRQLLGRPPFSSQLPRGGDLEEPDWTASYRGGWQLLTPNAGSACDVDGIRHGFHGRASNDPWRVLEESEGACALAWEGHDLRVERRLAVAGDTLELDVELEGLVAGVPVVAVEHVSVGIELLDPDVEIELPAGRAWELSERNGPASAPAAAPTWPQALLLDGSLERCDRHAARQPRSRLLAVGDLPDGRAVVRNRARDQGLELTWDAGWLRHCWIWHEMRTYDGPWRGQAEILVVEPASVPHSLGLAAAVEHGQARRLDLGERIGYRVTARPLH